jgi:hypothetical protein
MASVLWPNGAMLADEEKDSGAASVFPELSDQWKEQSAAQSDWAHVSEDRLQNLRARYGVSWVLLENAAPIGDLFCPHRDGDLRVCQILDDHRQLLSGGSAPTGIEQAGKTDSALRNPAATKIRRSSHRHRDFSHLRFAVHV